MQRKIRRQRQRKIQKEMKRWQRAVAKLILPPVAAAGLLLSVAAYGFANPTDGTVTAGTGTITSSGATTSITQTSDKMAINWQSFGIGTGETVKFIQPGTNSIALNRVIGSDASAIYGTLTANGQVFLINPNGILFSPTAQVNVGGIVASTLNLSDSDFLSGNYTFGGDSAAAVVNRGALTANGGGYVALLGSQVSNEGVIVAREGTAVLGAGNQITLDFEGDGLLGLTVDQGAVDALAANKNLIQADGGLVLMTARAADALTTAAVNNSGMIRAQRVSNVNGEIILDAGTNGEVSVSGALDASAPDGGDGGFIETSGAKVKISDSATVTTLSAGGKNGVWLIDPDSFTIAASGGDMTGAAVSNALAGGNFSIASTTGASGSDGNINVNDTVNWNANKLTLTATHNININAAMTASGTAGLALEYGQGAVAVGNTSTYNVYAPVNLAATSSFSTKQGSNGAVKTYTIITGLGSATSRNDQTLQGMIGNLSGNYVLGANIDAGGASAWNYGEGFAPIGNDSAKFTGVFDGLGHSIFGLTMNRQSSTSYVGLFGYTSGATIRNVGLTGGQITFRPGSNDIGGLVGYNNGGSISNCYSQVGISDYDGGGGGIDVGGLVGYNNGGNISNSSSASRVSGGPGSLSIGGLVGYNNGGNISNSYSSSTVSGGSNSGNIGGLVGSNSGIISNSYNTGSVYNGSRLGGLVGSNSGSISDSYNTGRVSTGSQMGGLVGVNGGNISNSYSTGQVSAGFNDVGGLVGYNNGNISSNSYSTGWVFGFTNVGGLVGYNVGSISNSYYSTGTVRPGGDGGLNIGGLVGCNDNGGSISNSNSTGAVSCDYNGSMYIGGLVGENWGSILSSYSTSEVSGGDSSSNIGGLVGYNFNGGSISNSYSTGQVSGGAGSFNIGGLVGGAEIGSISNSYSTGAVSGDAGSSNIGGLAGWNNGGSINNSYSAGAVSGGAGSSNIGSLVGYNYNGGSISNSFSAGAVSGGAGSYQIGGLVGYNDGGTITHSSALTTDQMKSAATFQNAGWDIATVGGSGSVWRIYDGYSYPLLRSFLTPLTVSADSVSKTYDGNVYTTAPTNVAYSLPGAAGDPLLQGKDTLSYGTAKNAGTYGLTGGLYCTGFFTDSTGATVQKGYDVSYTGNLTINKAALTVTGYSGSRTYGADNSTITYAGDLSGKVGADDVTISGTVAGSVTNRSNAGAYSGVLTGSVSGTDASNYTLTEVTGNLTINKAALTVTGYGGSRTYGDDNSTIAYSGTLNGKKFMDDDVILSGTVGSGIGNRSNAGAYSGVLTGSLSGTSASNYTLTEATGNLTINRAALTVSGVYGGSRTYGDDNSTIAYTGTLHGKKFADDAVILSSTVPSNITDRSDAGTYTDALTGSLDGASAGNYTLATVSGDLTINKAPLTVSGTYEGSRTYGDDNSAIAYTGTLSGKKFMDDDVTLSGTAGSGIDNKSNADTYADILSAGLSGGKASNYVLTTPVTGDLTINKAVLTVTGYGGSRTYGDENLTITYTGELTGKKFDDDVVALVNGVDSTVTNRSNAGAYAGALTGSLSGTSASNYTLNGATGDLTINKAALIVSGVYGGSRTYGDDNSTIAYTGTLHGKKFADDAVTLSSTVPSNITDRSDAGTYTDALTGSLDGASAGNYTLATVSGDLTINKAPLTVSGTYVGSRTYGDDNSTIAYSGTLNGKKFTDDDVILKGTVGSGITNRSNAGAYSGVLTGSLSGNDAANYTLTTVTGDLTIDKADLTVTANNASKNYDGLAYSGGSGVSYSGFIANEDASVLGGNLSYGGGSQGAINTGTYEITVSGLTSINYQISYVNGILTITPPIDDRYQAALMNHFVGLKDLFTEPYENNLWLTIINNGINLDGILWDNLENEDPEIR